MSGSSGYDISASQSSSDSTTQTARNEFGDFNNGGGIRIPSYFWPVALIVVGLLAFAWIKNRK
jgi:hypothetical protein